MDLSCHTGPGPGPVRDPVPAAGTGSRTGPRPGSQLSPEPQCVGLQEICLYGFYAESTPQKTHSMEAGIMVVSGTIGRLTE